MSFFLEEILDVFVRSRFDSLREHFGGPSYESIILRFEPIKRAQSPQVLPDGSASRAEGLASVYKMSNIPYGRRFPAACYRELQFSIPL